MKATEELLDLETYLDRMQMTKDEARESLRKLYSGKELARYIYSDNLSRKASTLNGELKTQIITESGLVKAIHVHGYDTISGIITNGKMDFIPELDLFCNLDFEGSIF